MRIKKRSIFAADDFDELDNENFAEDERQAEENAEAAEELEEDIHGEAEEEAKEDEVLIDIDNNITDHLIAECENCKGIFISAMISSDQEVDSINGICPLCNKDTTQTLKWIIKDYPN